LYEHFYKIVNVNILYQTTLIFTFLTMGDSNDNVYKSIEKDFITTVDTFDRIMRGIMKSISNLKLTQNG